MRGSVEAGVVPKKENLNSSFYIFPLISFFGEKSQIAVKITETFPHVHFYMLMFSFSHYHPPSLL